MTFWDWMVANPDALGTGAGLFGWSHFVTFFIIIAVIAGLSFAFYYHRTFARRFVLVMGIFMVTSRVFRMIFRTIVLWHGTITLAEELIPWNLCHIMCFLLGFALIFHNPDKQHGRTYKILVTMVSWYALIGGMLVFMFGNYYEFSIMSYYDIESILLHIFLPVGWLYFLAIRQMEFSYTSILCVMAGMFLLWGYGIIGNAWLVPYNPKANIMFVHYNGLPFSFYPRAHFLWTYATMAAAGYLIAFISLFVKRKLKHKPSPTRP
jgi:hypothetical protein